MRRSIPQIVLPLAVGIGLGLSTQSLFQPRLLPPLFEPSGDVLLQEAGHPAQHSIPQAELDEVVPVQLVSAPNRSPALLRQSHCLGSSRT